MPAHDTIVSVYCHGDPSVGLHGTETKFSLGYPIEMDEEVIESTRKLIRDLFAELWDDGNTVVVFDCDPAEGY